MRQRGVARVNTRALYRDQNRELAATSATPRLKRPELRLWPPRTARKRPARARRIPSRNTGLTVQNRRHRAYSPRALALREEERVSSWITATAYCSPLLSESRNSTNCSLGMKLCLASLMNFSSIRGMSRAFSHRSWL